MKKFEIGKEYFDRSACNHDCIFTIKIIKRTEKTVTFERNGKTRRAKLFFDERGEYIIPERYSMAPVFRAENEVQPEEEPSVEEAAAETSCGVEIAQPADVNTVVVMVGQRVERVCGACYPPQGGTVIGFVSLPDTRFFHGGVFAMVLYDGAKAPERVRLSDIHRRGWRSAGGSQRRKIFLLFRIFPIDFILTLVYNKSIKKGGDTVKKKKKKPTKSRVDVRTIVITAIVDFLVGLALLIIDKLT